jgi:hypothetical protein
MSTILIDILLVIASVFLLVLLFLILQVVWVVHDIKKISKNVKHMTSRVDVWLLKSLVDLIKGHVKSKS